MSDTTEDDIPSETPADRFAALKISHPDILYTPPRRPPPGQRPESIYVDESSTSGCRLAGYGGIWIPDADAEALRSAVAEVCARHAMRRELKWTKLSGGRASPIFQSLADAFFDHPSARFNAMVIEGNHRSAVSQYDDDELTHYKRLHWLCRKRVESSASYQLVLDHRTDKRADRLDDLKLVLNNAARLELRISFDCIRSVIAVDSCDEPLVQLADVLLGAVCYHHNGRHVERGASASKCEAAAYVARRAGFAGGIIGESPRWEKKFNVWRWRDR